MGYAAPSYEPAQVDVKLDRGGHVTSAHVVRNGIKANSILCDTVLAAAKQWVFKPATFRGAVIESNHTIVFRFKSPGE